MQKVFQKCSQDLDYILSLSAVFSLFLTFIIALSQWGRQCKKKDSTVTSHQTPNVISHYFSGNPLQSFYVQSFSMGSKICGPIKFLSELNGTDDYCNV